MIRQQEVAAAWLAGLRHAQACSGCPLCTENPAVVLGNLLKAAGGDVDEASVAEAAALCEKPLKDWTR